MPIVVKYLIFNVLIGFSLFTAAQRTYVSNSVLASGTWYEFRVSQAGVYKIDIGFLNSLGISGNIPSSQIRIYGNGGGMLPEANNVKRFDDLQENSIFVNDGGDGVLDGSDYILLYSDGPDKWIRDSASKSFSHQKNLYSDKCFYFLTIGGQGLRIANQVNSPVPNVNVTAFDEHYFHELDSINFLYSGKQWYGEEFSNNPGRTVSRSFNFPFNDVIAGANCSVSTSVVARSVNTPSHFSVLVNNMEVQQINVPQVGTGTYDLFAQQVQNKNNFTSTLGNSLTITYSPGSFGSEGWLNWFEFFCRRPLNISPDQQLLFRDWNSVGSGIAGFSITSSAQLVQVWDVTSSLHPVQMKISANGNQLFFSNDARSLHEYIAFSGNFLIPVAIGRISNQNLHSSTPADLIIVSYPEFKKQAQSLAQFHVQKNNLRVVVASTTEIFNEFSSGAPDPSAIRDFVKFYYDKYRSDWTKTDKYLLLFGKGSFDYKNRIQNNTNFVPAYESDNSLDPLATYTSDDFFGYLDDYEDINSGLVTNLLDIGIGRIPVKNEIEAQNYLAKLNDYYSPNALDIWRNTVDFVADDKDNDLHLQDAETLSATLASNDTAINIQKIYLDAFKKEGGSGGGTYPQANLTINSDLFGGALLWNYNGHGGPQRLAEEDILDQNIVNNINNQYKLPLFVTATCDFAAYDNPLINSLGEDLLIRPKTGAIGLMTTTRVVFAYSNLIIDNNYIQFAFNADGNNQHKSLGASLQLAKNFTYQSSGDIINNRKFTLLGDPAMTLGFPVNKVKLNKVNGKNILNNTDTLAATEFVTLEGEVDDFKGNLISNFQGTAYATLFDKPQTITTLGNEPDSPPVPYLDQQQIIFKGKVSALNGKFTFHFRIPKDINYKYGNGKLSLYAQDGIRDGNGYSKKIIIGGISGSGINDNTGPEIKAYLNDDKFVNGSITNSSPILIVHLSDSSGINTSRSGIDHDITATLDNNNQSYFVLNNYFESDLNSYQKGTIRFKLPELTPGIHSLKIKAWDVLNNSSTYILDFNVINSQELKIEHVLNYPNPFTTHTQFWFEHNYPSTDLYVKIEVFTLTGKLIKTITQTINTPGNRSSEIEWDGKDEFGNKIGRGVYIYRLKVRSPNGKTADKWERLVILM